MGLNLDVAAVTLLDSRDIPSKLSARSGLKKGSKTHHREQGAARPELFPGVVYMVYFGFCRICLLLWQPQPPPTPGASEEVLDTGA